MIKRKMIAKRITALLLSAVMVLGSGTLAFAAGGDSVTGDEAVYKSIIDETPSSSETVDKEETVYAIMTADGQIDKIVVDELLNNKKGSDTINDVSILEGIENLSGTEEFDQEGTNITWHANGKPIRYEGNAYEQLPVDVEVSYYLNGEKKTAEEIAGQAGNVEIHFDYQINRMEYPYGYEMFHPYVMASGLSFDNEHFTNISSDNGKTINSGDNTICMGFALPGLKYNLGIEDTDGMQLDIPESVVIRASTDKFSIGGTYTVAVTGVLEAAGLDEAIEEADDKAAALEAGLGALVDAGNKLTRGSSQLADGISQLAGGIRTLKKKTSKLGPGIKALAKGAEELRNGTAQVLEGTEELKSGVEELDDGAKQLDEGASQLKDGTEQLAEGTAQLKEGTEELKEGTGKLSRATELMKYGADAVLIEAAVVKVETTVLKHDAIKLEGQTQEVADGLHDLADSDDGTGGLKLDVEADSIELGFNGVVSKGSGIRQTARSYRNSISAYKSRLSKARGLVKDGGKKALIDQAMGELNGLESYLASVESYVDTVDTASYEASKASASVSAKVNNLKVSLSAIRSSSNNRHKSLEELAAKADAANDTAEKVRAEAITADATATVLAVSAGLLAILGNKVDDGAKQLDEGAAKLDEGAGQVNDGAQQLNEAAGQLADGIHRLSEGTGELVNGVTRLNDAVGLLDGGAGQLSEGLTTLNKGSVELLKGINQLAAGAGKAEDGADELAAGMAKFNREGIQAFAAALGGSGLTGMIDRLEALLEADKTSTFYGGKAERDTGESRIIFKTASISAPDDDDADSETSEESAESE